MRSAAGWRAALGVRLPACLCVGVILTGCATGGTVPSVSPPADGASGPAVDPRPDAESPALAQPAPKPLPAATRLPAVPRVTGVPALRVQYPRPLQRIAVRDSNFLFGTTGSGDAELWIDGTPVPVEANGAFLAWLPVPTPARGDTAEYRLIARSPGGSDTVRHRVLLPAGPYEGPPGEVWIDGSSLPRPIERWLFPDDSLEFAVRATPGIRVELQLGGGRARLREVGPGLYRGELLAGRVMEGTRCSASRVDQERAMCRPGVPDTLDLEVVASDGRRTAIERRRQPIARLDPDALPIVVLREKPDPIHGESGVVPGRPTPYGPYAWLFPDGAWAQADGRAGDRVRLRLTRDLTAWVAAEDVEPGAGNGALQARVGWIEAEEGPEGVSAVRIPLDAAVPAHVEEPGDRILRLVLYGALGDTERMAYGSSEASESREIESLAWAQRSGGLYELTLRLRRPAWGHRLSYASGPAGSTELLLEVRHPPDVDPRDPLRGRKIAVDAGHPPVGAFGPTGLFEGDANLAVARRLAALLEEAGAEPILVRRDTLPLGLYRRAAIAVRFAAEVFVSIHNNALPDGTRPFGEEGTSTYYYHPHSRRLAESVQTGLVASMGLRDLGMWWGNFAQTRLTWMPSVLAEGAFMMFPRHEAALRTPEFQEAYARGLLWGLEEYLRTSARPEESEDE